MGTGKVTGQRIHFCLTAVVAVLLVPAAFLLASE
jgi:hypothetical protein